MLRPLFFKIRHLRGHLARLAWETVRDLMAAAVEEADLAMAERLDDIIGCLERTIRERARIDAPDTLELLQTIPGVGRILGLTLLI